MEMRWKINSTGCEMLVNSQLMFTAAHSSASHAMVQCMVVSEEAFNEHGTCLMPPHCLTDVKWRGISRILNNKRIERSSKHRRGDWQLKKGNAQSETPALRLLKPWMKCITSKFNEGGKDANLRAEGYISNGPSGHCRSWRAGDRTGEGWADVACKESFKHELWVDEVKE
ncbi:unnamed protein product [Sphagnum jensenii]|uniref:Uncharacterized protein n=1 Tax=Sphagnum jensenii TaxID=128206 RepID=A0ABP0XD55_9BRYO